MKRLLCVLFAVIMLLLAGCGFVQSAVAGQSAPDGKNIDSYQLTEDGTIAAPDGTEYESVCVEGFLELLGRKTLVGVVKGEEGQKSYGFENGLYACEQDTDRVMLLRYMPESEWGVFYRKKTAPLLDYSLQNCVRLELIGYHEIEFHSDENMYSAGAEHINCGKGIAGKGNVTAFFESVMAVGPAVGLYALAENEDGTPDNCYGYGTIYGYFEGETAAAIPFNVTSYNNKAYSIMIDNVEYALPIEYLELLREP